MGLFPHWCLLCEQSVEGATRESPPGGRDLHQDLDLCDWCRASLPWNHDPCPRCAMPLADPASPACGFCLTKPFSCSRMIAPFIYADAIARWIRRFKFNQGFREGHVLAGLSAGAVARMRGDATLPDTILPIPLSLRRVLFRGHNQAIALAAAMAKATGTPLDVNTLRRVRHTAHQAGLARSARSANVRRAFIASSAVEGRRIALVDDVCTTGATLEAATQAVQAAGAIDVEWWVIARTR